MGPLAAFQHHLLESHAESAGFWSNLLHFHAYRGDFEAVRALETRLTQAEDRLVYALLAARHGFGDRVPPLDELAPAATPWAWHTAVELHLHRDDVRAAVEVAVLGLRVNRHDTGPLNLVAKWGYLRGDYGLASEVAGESVRLNPHQTDMARLKAAAESGDGALAFAFDWNTPPRGPAVAFYLPCYRVEAFIEAAIRGIAAQNYPVAEILVIDDGSPDRSAALARAFPVRVVTHEENRGLAAARNSAFHETQAELVGAIDTDAYPEPDFTQNALLELATGPAALAGVGGALVETHRESPADKWRHVYLNQGQGPARKYAGEGLVGADIILRRDAVLAVGGYDEKYRTNAEDMALCRALAAAGYDYVYTPLCIAHHTRRDTPVSAVNTAWNYGYWAKVESGAYAHLGSFFAALERCRTVTQGCFTRDYAPGREDLLYVDLLFVTVCTVRDAAAAVQHGLLSPAEGRVLQEHMLALPTDLDRRFGSGLLNPVRTAVGPHLIEASPDLAAIRPEVETYLAQFAEGAATLREAITRPMYAAMRDTAIRHPG